MILIKDDEFIRGNCPMTKEDIRALSIWKMNLKEKLLSLKKKTYFHLYMEMKNCK